MDNITKSDCVVWKEDPTRNPRNKRKLQTDAKKGIYNQLVKICEILLKEEKEEKPKDDKPKGDSTVPDIDDNLEADRLRLIRAIRKAIKPILHRIDTTEMRIKYSNIISNYIKNVQPCLEESVVTQNNKAVKKLVLVDNNATPTVIFDKQIGSESAVGVAYMNMGKRFANLLKFSCKLMSVSKNNTTETKILKEMSEGVIRGITPNMPLTYNVLECKNKCTLPLCPKVAQNKYYVVMSELANCDIQTWFREKHTEMEYCSVIVQLLIAVETFHKMGYAHRDTHLGNFLIHKIKPGGYWHYQEKETYDNLNIYIPNTGYLLVLWDPGLAIKTKGMNYREIAYHQKNDLMRPLRLMMAIATHPVYIERGLKRLPDKVNKMISIMNDKINQGYNTTSVISQTLKYPELNDLPHGIKVANDFYGEKVTKSLIINDKPYSLNTINLKEIRENEKKEDKKIAKKAAKNKK
jgi:serine/threonine protein kinase